MPVLFGFIPHNNECQNRCSEAQRRTGSEVAVKDFDQI